MIGNALDFEPLNLQSDLNTDLIQVFLHVRRYAYRVTTLSRGMFTPCFPAKEVAMLFPRSYVAHNILSDRFLLYPFVVVTNPVKTPEFPMSIARVREHVNPLSLKYQTPATAPDWQQIYTNPVQPMHLDIGCARGRFAMQMAQMKPTWNFLGLEIREPLVIQANEWRDQQALSNLHYLYCNANNSLQPILKSLPSGALQFVTIQFPDPWFKQRHKKRRVVQAELVQDLADFLPCGAIVFIQSDILDVAEEMRDRFQENPLFKIQNPEWSQENIMPIPTEREVGVLEAGEPVYRAVFHRV